ncbi:MAG: NIPSNAP family protein [Dehalococcoidia bacterium]|nr:NIPSNAP family protein [Dehalococcoidia bacterium]
MIYDMRTYDIAMGKTPEYMAAVREIALPVRETYGIKLAGWYYTDIGALNKVVHIWAYRDFAHFEEAREAFRTDERWVNDYVPRVKGIILRQENQIMRASDFFESILMASDKTECEAEEAGPEDTDSGTDDVDKADTDSADAEEADAGEEAAESS